MKQQFKVWQSQLHFKAASNMLKYLLSPHVFFFFALEASKVVMQYVAAVSGKGWEVDRVKEQLLQSNPVLEGE